MSIHHTEQCQNSQRRHQAEVAAYVAQWPDACPACNGWGGTVERYDPSPAGVALSGRWFTEFEPCEHCYCTGHCPRCKFEFAQDILSKEEPCPHCGWYEGVQGAPPVTYGCECWAASVMAELLSEEEPPAKQPVLAQVGQRVKGRGCDSFKIGDKYEYIRYEYTGTVLSTDLHPNPTIGHTCYIRMDTPLPWTWGDPWIIVHCAGTGAYNQLEIIG